MKKRKIIIIGIIVLVIIITIVLGYFIKNNIDKNNEEKLLMERIKYLLESSYDYYYFTLGDVKTTEAFVEVDGERYYYVNEDEYKQIDDLINLVENIFVPEKITNYISKINDSHKYLQVDDKMYIKKNEEVCQVEYNVNYDNMNIEDIDDDTKLLTWDNNFTYIYLVNDKWYLSTEVFYCIDNTELNNLGEE